MADLVAPVANMLLAAVMAGGLNRDEQLDSDGFSPRITPPTRRGQGPRRAI